MITWAINQVTLAVFNYINSRVDAYRILRHKTIAHAVNFGAYTLFCGILCWLARWNIGVITLFCVSAFCNRQFTFDIPLNLRRHLPFDYVTKAKPPAAWLDRQEIRLFGYNGRAPLVMYGSIWLLCFILKFFI